MSFKKWMLILISTMLVVTMMIAGFNALVDPFGIFGDKILDWYSYNITNNPRTAKIGYLDEHYENYDSYIIGCSKTSSLSTDVLNEYNPGSSFYNLMMYGGDLYDIEKTAFYVIDNYNVENIIINIGLEEAVKFNTSQDKMKSVLHSKLTDESNLLFFGKYMFANPSYSLEKLQALFKVGYLPTKYDVFIADKGVYNKSKRDIESIVSLEDYKTNNPGFSYGLGTNTMESMDLAVESIRNIKEYCKKNGILFKLIVSPVSDKELESYSVDELKEYFIKLSGVTEFWDFSGYTSISAESRYYYDNYHFRNTVGDMVLAKIYGDKDKYIPANFGHLTDAENVQKRVSEAFEKNETSYTAEYAKKVPILMYHHIAKDDTEGNGAIVTSKKFRSDMETLKQNGYTAVFYDELVGYVYDGDELPEKPVVITFDDGYESNYIYAYPILKELDMKATISVIGVSVGKSQYKDTNKDMFPHFTFEEAKEMYDSGVVDIQNHSFDMHQVEIYDGPEYRLGSLRKGNEKEVGYIDIFRADYNKLKTAIEENVGNEVFVYTYPYGFRDDLTEVLLKELKNKVTITVDEGINEILKGLPQSLNAMKRINVTEDISSERLIEILKYYEEE